MINIETTLIGPLVLEGTNTLVGIVSYGTAICAVNVPDVYTSNISTLFFQLFY